MEVQECIPSPQATIRQWLNLEARKSDPMGIFDSHPGKPCQEVGRLAVVVLLSAGQRTNGRQ